MVSNVALMKIYSLINASREKGLFFFEGRFTEGKETSNAVMY